MARYRSARRELVWGGLALALLGLVVAAYSVTGERIYDITWAPVFVLGTAAALAGAAVAAYGRAGPRTQAEPLLPHRGNPVGDPTGKGGADADEAAGAEADTGVSEAPAADPPPAPTAAELDSHDGPREVVVIDCPDCGHRFRDEGVRPFRARCPECGLPGRIPADPPTA